MFWEPGHCYIYQIYGMHRCVNLVTEKAGTGAAILIRALEPLYGVEIIKESRGAVPVRNLLNGPGKVCQAMGIDQSMLGANMLTSEVIRIAPYKKIPNQEIAQSRRIGIRRATELEWRFYLLNNKWVSPAKFNHYQPLSKCC